MSELSIGQVAERTGLSVHALRFYEREGLFASPVRRAPGGRRRYTDDDVAWLEVCVILRESGMPLPMIRRYTELIREGSGTERERLRLMREHEQRVVEQIDRLTKSLDLIRHKVGIYEDIVESDTEATGGVDTCTVATDTAPTDTLAIDTAATGEHQPTG